MLSTEKAAGAGIGHHLVRAGRAAAERLLNRMRDMTVSFLIASCPGFIGTAPHGRVKSNCPASLESASTWWRRFADFGLSNASRRVRSRGLCQ